MKKRRIRKEHNPKRWKKYHTISIIFIAILILFFIMHAERLKMTGGFTGFAIFNSQPASEGVDSYIREGSDSNYGGQEVLKVGKTAAGLGLRSLIYFNISEVPETDTIVSAKIQVYESYSSNGNPITIKLYLLTFNWSESEAGWNNRSLLELWSSAGGDYGKLIDSVSFSSSGYYNFTVTQAVRAWRNGTSENYGLIMLSENAGTGDYKDIDSSDSLIAGQRPSIIIDHEGNAVPTILNLSSDSSSLTPKKIGDNLQFTIDWEDIEGNSANAFVCNSSSITVSGCAGKTFCSNPSTNSSPIICNYTIISSDNGTTNYFAAVCDANCSLISNSSFYMNHPPNVYLLHPSAGEIINQSTGNWTFYFNATDLDYNTMNAKIYYSEIQNFAEHLIASVNVSTCYQGRCNYSWDSTGLYGTYYFTLHVNDSFSQTNVSSSGISVYSLIDSQAPRINESWTESYIYSGKQTNIYANITEENLYSAWAVLNYTSANITLSNISLGTYSGNFTAFAVGNYELKIYAIDRNGNLNDSSQWIVFNVSKPSATAQNGDAPSVALPYHTVKITSGLYATDSLKNVYAYLNVPDGFTFLSGYSQNYYLGNFSNGQSKNATWFVSVPLDESIYALNTTYTDAYSNVWTSGNFNISVSSAIGGYEISVSGYPEVETSNSYYTESFFKQNGVYKDADSMYVSIYDALGNLVAGPASMTQRSTGVYNYSYVVGPSVSEGIWKTIVNATKSSTNYYGYEFWKVVGGPFDVRDITIVNSNIGSLEISVVAENTGGANKDLILVWNLTNADTGQALTSGSDTFMVNANSERTWTIHPSTNYIGNAKIEFLGYYSQTEKAGAYKLFSTTSGNVSCGDGTCNGGESCSICPADCGVCPSAPSTGGGGGGETTKAPEQKKDYEIVLEDFRGEINVSKNIPKIVLFTIKNNGAKKLTNIKFAFENLEDDYYTVKQNLDSLEPGKTATIEVTILISDYIGEKYSAYLITSNETNLRADVLINVMRVEEFFSSEYKSLENEISSLRNSKPEFSDDLDKCQKIVDALKSNLEKEEFINAKENLDKAEECINNVRNKKPSTGGISFGHMNDYAVWIVTWVLITILIIVLGTALYLIYKKLTIINFMRQKEEMPKKPEDVSRKKMIDDKIKNIEDKLGSN